MNATQKNVVTLLVTVAVAVALGFYAFVGDKTPTAPPPPPPEEPPALLGRQDAGTVAAEAPPPLVMAIALDTPRGKLTLERQEEGWRITEPISSAADQPLVETLARELSVTKFKSVLETAPTEEDLVRYGLQPPVATVRIRLRESEPAGPATLTLQLGRDNTFDGSIYVRREGDPRVFQAHGALRLALFKGLDEWRDRLIFPVEERALLRVEIKVRDNRYTLERHASDQPWEMTRPVTMPADTERVRELVSDLRARQALGFPDAALEPRVREALKKPQAELAFVPTLGAPMRARVASLVVDGGPRVYALWEGHGEPMLAQVDSSLFSVIDLKPADLKTRQVLSLPSGSIDRIVIQPEGDVPPVLLQLAADAGQWEVVSPLPGRAKQFAVVSLLGALRKLEAQRVAEAHPKNLARYGLTPKSVSVTLLDPGGQQLARLWVGAPVTGMPQRLWAQGTSGDILEVDKANIDALPLSLEALMAQTSQGAAPGSDTP